MNQSEVKRNGVTALFQVVENDFIEYRLVTWTALRTALDGREPPGHRDATCAVQCSGTNSLIGSAHLWRQDTLLRTGCHPFQQHVADLGHTLSRTVGGNVLLQMPEFVVKVDQVDRRDAGNIV
jgi:hypothetical protein